MSAVINALQTNPELALVVAFIMRAALTWQRELTWPEYRTLMGLKRLTFPRLQRLAPGGFDRFVNQKGGRDDPEFYATVGTDIRATVKRLRAGGGSLHLLSSLKRRPNVWGDPLSIAHVVWTHDDGHQTEAYLFRNSDNTTDVYVHFEWSVTKPVDHLTTGQQNGDVRGVVADAIAEVVDDE